MVRLCEPVRRASGRVPVCLGYYVMLCQSGFGGAMRSKISPATRTSPTGTSKVMNCLNAAAVAPLRTTVHPY